MNIIHCFTNSFLVLYDSYNLKLAHPGLDNLDVMEETPGRLLIRQQLKLPSVKPCAFSMALVTGVVL